MGHRITRAASHLAVDEVKERMNTEVRQWVRLHWWIIYNGAPMRLKIPSLGSERPLEQIWYKTAAYLHPTSCCPLCTQPSDSIKTHYRRILRDAPCAGRQVQLALTVRKFYCRNPYCPQKVFTKK